MTHCPLRISDIVYPIWHITVFPPFIPYKLIQRSSYHHHLSPQSSRTYKLWLLSQTNKQTHISSYPCIYVTNCFITEKKTFVTLTPVAPVVYIIINISVQSEVKCIPTVSSLVVVDKSLDAKQYTRVVNAYAHKLQHLYPF